MQSAFPIAAFPVTLLPIAASSLLALVFSLYVRGWLRLRAKFPRLVPFGKAATFLAGVPVAWLAVVSPLAHLDRQLLLAHMVQDVALMALGAPLLLLGEPGPVLLHILPKSFVRVIPGRFLETRRLGLLGKALSHTTLCWLAGTLTVLAWHVPAVFELGHHSVRWHEMEQASFLLAGLLFWWPVIRPWPSTAEGLRRSVPSYLFLATLPCDALSVYLVFCDHVVYRPYLFVPRLFGLSAIQDQQWAGVFLWTSLTLIYLAPAVLVAIKLLSPASRKAQVFNATVSRTNPRNT